jgi:hypothetical protein
MAQSAYKGLLVLYVLVHTVRLVRRPRDRDVLRVKYYQISILDSQRELQSKFILSTTQQQQIRK